MKKIFCPRCGSDSVVSESDLVGSMKCNMCQYSWCTTGCQHTSEITLKDAIHNAAYKIHYSNFKSKEELSTALDEFKKEILSLVFVQCSYKECERPCQHKYIHLFYRPGCEPKCQKPDIMGIHRCIPLKGE